jgi:hypothetical protein
MIAYPMPFNKHISIIIVIIVLGHISLILLGKNMSSLFDFYLIGFFLFNFKLDKSDYKLYTASLVVILLILFRYLIFIPTWDSTYFFISLKLLIFFLLFISIKPKINVDKIKLLEKLKILFIVSCLLIISDKIYAFISGGVMFGLLFRPRLIGEINFDIVLIIQVWLLLKLYYPKYRKTYGFLLFFVVIISLSRSGIIGYAVTYFLYIQTKNKSFNFTYLIRNILLIFSGLALILLIYYIRDPELSFAYIDRIQLLALLADSYTDDSWFNLLFGHGLLVPLPDSICIPFSFFALATTGDEGNCNPVILLSYFLRCTFEYGLLVTVLIPFYYFKLLTKTVNNVTALALVMPTIAVSLSVGGFYNSLAIITLVMAKYTAAAFGTEEKAPVVI